MKLKKGEFGSSLPKVKHLFNEKSSSLYKILLIDSEAQLNSRKKRSL